MKLQALFIQGGSRSPLKSYWQKYRIKRSILLGLNWAKKHNWSGVRQSPTQTTEEEAKNVPQRRTGAAPQNNEYQPNMQHALWLMDAQRFCRVPLIKGTPDKAAEIDKQAMERITTRNRVHWTHKKKILETPSLNQTCGRHITIYRRHKVSPRELLPLTKEGTVWKPLKALVMRNNKGIEFDNRNDN